MPEAKVQGLGYRTRILGEAKPGFQRAVRTSLDDPNGVVVVSPDVRESNGQHRGSDPDPDEINMCTKQKVRGVNVSKIYKGFGVPRIE